MNFEWSGEQQTLYEEIRRFLREEPGEAEPLRLRWKTYARAGLTGLPVSPAYGGRGLDCLSTAHALEAVGRECTDSGFAFALAAHLMVCCVPLDRYGTDEQKAAYLPALCAGEWIGAGAVTEREAGSDAFALRATAVRDGDDYILDGEKTFVTNAPLARVLIVYAATRATRGPFALSAFLVDRDRPGVEIGEPVEKGGLTTAQMATVRLTRCRIPQARRLGPEGAGGRIFHESMGWERSCLFALWIGTLERQLDEVVRHARTRRQFARPIGANQAVSHRIADMKLRLEAARLLLYRACWRRTRGEPADLDTSLAKLAVSEAFVQSSIDAVRIFGGAGVVRSGGIERYVRDALPSTIYSGTNDIQRELIARELGLGPGRTGD
jgi:alkylation response protein AidB-like acyl-CoA dehydrogenase